MGIDAICPDCGRGKASNATDIINGCCPKWYAVRDAEAISDCESYKINRLLSDALSPVMKPLKFIQIQVVPVPNEPNTQCHAFMYGLDKDGRIWFKRDNDDRWCPESMKSNGEEHDN